MWITPSRLWLDNKSWMNREVHVQFCESAGVKLPCATRPYIRGKGEWQYLYRAVDRDGQTIDFLLMPQHDRVAAEAFLYKAIRTHGRPETITIGQSGSNTAATTCCNKTHQTTIAIRHSKYLKNIVEQDQWQGRGNEGFSQNEQFVQCFVTPTKERT
jgi:transposase-like protein